ncbi:MAG: CHAP domain-containing protein [Actinobacteria bacterium]|nr:CHAP domain-containing protein [Actinomycetota bacterium]
MTITVEAVLRAARSQLGITEVPFGSNKVKYNDWAGVPPGPWCAAFVSWCLDQGGALDVPRFVYCPTGVNAYKAAGRWGTSPRIGAVIFYQWPGEDRACHTGLVEAVRSDGAKVALEGNTDVAGGGSGGKVMRQVRRAFILGYGYPKYDAIQEVQPVKATWDPPLPVVDYLENPNGPGGWGLAPDGGIFAFGGAPFSGSAAGKDYFRGRVAAKLQLSPDQKPMVVATSGEVYGPSY